MMKRMQPRIDVTDVFAMKSLQFDFEGLIRNICGSLEVYVKEAPAETDTEEKPVGEGGLNLHDEDSVSVSAEGSLSLAVSDSHERQGSQDNDEETWAWQPLLLDVQQREDNKWAWVVQEVVSVPQKPDEVQELRLVRVIGLCDIEAIRISKKDTREFRIEVVDDTDSASDASDASGADVAGAFVGGRADYKRTEKLSMVKMRTCDEKPCERWVHAVSEVVTRLRFMQPREELSVERLDSLMS